MNKEIKLTFLLPAIVLGLFVITVLWFYLTPYFTTKYIPPPESEELRKIRESYDEKGYLTPQDVEALNRLGEEQIENLKSNNSKKD